MHLPFKSYYHGLTSALLLSFSPLIPAQTNGGPPRILATTPAAGATEVDAGLGEITITFDRDMADGFSWTGGGPDFPAMADGKKPYWRDRRTCAFPVKLEPGRFYRVGLNSTSFKNFRGVDGVPVQPSAIYFTTQGAGAELTRKVAKPVVMQFEPANGAQAVDPTTKELKITFSVEMGGGVSWTGGGPGFPAIPEGRKATWSEDRKTCTLPVSIKPGQSYRIGLNSPSHQNFQSSGGVPLEPVVYTFRTRE